MKKKIIIVGIILVILVIATFFILNHKKGYKGYGFDYKIPGNYKFIIIAKDLSAVDGPSISYIIYEDKIIRSEGDGGPSHLSSKIIVYEDVDTSNIEYIKPKETNGIYRTDTTKIEEALKGKKGKTVCDYVRYTN